MKITTYHRIKGQYPKKIKKHNTVLDFGGVQQQLD